MSEGIPPAAPPSELIDKLHTLANAGSLNITKDDWAQFLAKKQTDPTWSPFNTVTGGGESEGGNSKRRERKSPRGKQLHVKPFDPQVNFCPPVNKSFIYQTDPVGYTRQVEEQYRKEHAVEVHRFKYSKTPTPQVENWAGSYSRSERPCLASVVKAIKKPYIAPTPAQRKKQMSKRKEEMNSIQPPASQRKKISLQHRLPPISSAAAKYQQPIKIVSRRRLKASECVFK